MTASLDAETRALVAHTVLTAQRTLPNLAVAVTPHTRGKRYLVDRCCSRIWVDANLPGDTLVAALREAVTVLREYQAVVTTVIPAQRKASVPVA